MAHPLKVVGGGSWSRTKLDKIMSSVFSFTFSSSKGELGYPDSSFCKPRHVKVHLTEDFVVVFLSWNESAGPPCSTPLVYYLC